MSEDKEKRNSKFIRFAGACGLVSSVLPLVLILSATFLSPWFRWDINALSDLGVHEQAWMFNGAVMIGGVLSFLFALGFRRYFRKERLGKMGATSLMLSDICLFLIGIFTEKYLAVHAVVAIGLFLLGPLGFILIGYGSDKNSIRKFSIACGIAAYLGIIALPIVASFLYLRMGFAVPELAQSLITSTWTIAVSIQLLKNKTNVPLQ